MEQDSDCSDSPPRAPETWGWFSWTDHDRIRGYDPTESQVSDDCLAAFVTREVLSEDVCDVPGIGPKAKEVLEEAGITSTYQLMGKYLMLRELGMTTQEHCDAFKAWLMRIKLRFHLNGITRSIAERMNVTIPGIYDDSTL